MHSLEAFMFALTLLTASGTFGSPVKNSPRDASYPELHYIGSTATKEYYMTKEKITGLTSDFATSLKHICVNIFQMDLASVESEEEFGLIDNWLMTEFDNSTSSPAAWTSGLALVPGKIQWASTGADFNLPRAVIGTPWRAGSGSSPAYSWNICLSILKKCHPPPSAPSGCYPLRTEFYYDDCREKRPVICQRIKQ